VCNPIFSLATVRTASLSEQCVQPRAGRGLSFETADPTSSVCGHQRSSTGPYDANPIYQLGHLGPGTRTPYRLIGRSHPRQLTLRANGWKWNSGNFVIKLESSQEVIDSQGGHCGCWSPVGSKILPRMVNFFTPCPCAVPMHTLPSGRVLGD
jgi:hypothetical protein